MLADLDLLSFDRLMQKAAEARNRDIAERAHVALGAIAAGFNGGEAAAAFDKLMDAYAPASERAKREEQKVTQSISSLQRMFGS